MRVFIRDLQENMMELIIGGAFCLLLYPCMWAMFWLFAVLRELMQ